MQCGWRTPEMTIQMINWHCRMGQTEKKVIIKTNHGLMERRELKKIIMQGEIFSQFWNLSEEKHSI